MNLWKQYLKVQENPIWINEFHDSQHQGNWRIKESTMDQETQIRTKNRLRLYLGSKGFRFQ